jgi:hypothetical protein
LLCCVSYYMFLVFDFEASTRGALNHKSVIPRKKSQALTKKSIKQGDPSRRGRTNVLFYIGETLDTCRDRDSAPGDYRSIHVYTRLRSPSALGTDKPRLQSYASNCCHKPAYRERPNLIDVRLHDAHTGAKYQAEFAKFLVSSKKLNGCQTGSKTRRRCISKLALGFSDAAVLSVEVRPEASMNERMGYFPRVFARTCLQESTNSTVQSRRARHYFWFVRRNRGWTGVRAACQVSDRD